MNFIKDLFTRLLIGLILGIFVFICLIASPLIMCSYILDWAVSIEDELSKTKHSTIYLSENGIEWEAVKP